VLRADPVPYRAQAAAAKELPNEGAHARVLVWLLACLGNADCSSSSRVEIELTRAIRLSKKLYSTSAWRRRVALKKRDAEKRQKHRSSRPRRGFRPQLRRLPKQLDAPSNFSVLHNAEEVVQFLDRIERFIENFTLTINFEDVVEITPEAVLALIATIKKFTSRPVHGSVPKLEKARQILIETGFFRHVKHGLALQSTSQGLIERFEGTKVDPVLARELIMHGTEQMTGERTDSEPAYCVILEAMQNTVDHAHVTPGRGFNPLKTETWWAMVYADTGRKRICFALLDTGVGIFKSAKVKKWRRADRLIRKAADISILKRMLQGGIESRTGLDYRGKGLPSMNRYCESGEIRDFLILSNAVLGKIEDQAFTALNYQFPGTMLYWEIVI
jgi:hypothetical protein